MKIIKEVLKSKTAGEIFDVDDRLAMAPGDKVLYVEYLEKEGSYESLKEAGELLESTAHTHNGVLINPWGGTIEALRKALDLFKKAGYGQRHGDSWFWAKHAHYFAAMATDNWRVAGIAAECFHLAGDEELKALMEKRENQGWKKQQKENERR